MFMKIATPTSLFTLLLVVNAGAQGSRGGIPARAALDRIAVTHGPKAVEKIVEMTGKRGQTQPREWWIVAHDDRSPFRLRTMWVGDVRATDEGGNKNFYPEQEPIGFLSTAKLKVDSTKAFEILVREATAAKVGFDSVDYKLRSLEFGDEPIWSLTARDSRGALLGRVVMSGFDGRVFRTVWYYKQPSGYPRIVDSAIDGLAKPSLGSAALVPPVDDPLTRPGADVPVPLSPLSPLDPGDPGDPGSEAAEVQPLPIPAPSPGAPAAPGTSPVVPAEPVPTPPVAPSVPDPPERIPIPL